MYQKYIKYCKKYFNAANGSTFASTSSSSATTFKRPNGIPTPRPVSKELHDIILQQTNGNSKETIRKNEIASKIITEEDLEKFEIRCKSSKNQKKVFHKNIF